MQRNHYQHLYRLLAGALTLLTGLFLICGAAEPICCDVSPTPNLCCQSGSLGHHLFLGPECMNVKRSRKGGAKQNGWLTGGRFIYEHCRRYCFYWGLEASYARGTLRGHTGGGNPSKSIMSDGSVEGRFGYTFKYKYGWQPALTPFFGVGYLWEINNFKSPSPIPLHNRIQCRYVTAGFLASISPLDNFTVGLNVKVRYLKDPRCHTSNDPLSDIDSMDQNISNDRFQYRIELPITYVPCGSCWGGALLPFYEKRFYGGFADEVDFKKMQLYYYGVALMLERQF